MLVGASRTHFLVLPGYRRFDREDDVDLSSTVLAGLSYAPRALGYPTDGVIPMLKASAGARLPGGFVQALAAGQETQNRNAFQLFGIHMAFLRRERGGLDDLAAAIGASNTTGTCRVLILRAPTRRTARSPARRPTAAASSRSSDARALVYQ